MCGHCQHGEHHHEHGCCGGHCCRRGQQTIELTQREHAFLMCLAQIPFLPLARFVLASSQAEHVGAIALAPVYLVDRDETLERVKQTGAVLLALQEKGLVSLDYGRPLQGCGYEDYQDSAVYRSFRQAVSEGGQREGFLFDLPKLEKGSMALTALGRQAVEQLDIA